MTALYSLLHFLTDGLCALAMFGRFHQDASRFYLYILLYNFCAFALQLPFGAAVDLLRKRYPEKKGQWAAYCAVFGAGLTIIGAFTHPVILGLGNALFHVGGGIGTMDEDRKKEKKGALLGIFVSPGAIGLYLGTVLGKQLPYGFVFSLSITVSFLYMAVSFFLLVKARGYRILQNGRKWSLIKLSEDEDAMQEKGLSESPELSDSKLPLTKYAVTASALLFLVVVIRSYTGMAVTFSWKEGFTAGLLATFCIAGGKALGGILAAKFGDVKIMALSLLLGALAYAFSGYMAFGLAALLLFNMTMPVTLYMIADRFKSLSGFSFGLLTMALFIGFVPVYLGAEAFLKPPCLGALMCFVSLGLLLAARVLLNREGEETGKETALKRAEAR